MVPELEISLEEICMEVCQLIKDGAKFLKDFGNGTAPLVNFAMAKSGYGVHNFQRSNGVLFQQAHNGCSRKSKYV